MGQLYSEPVSLKPLKDKDGAWEMSVGRVLHSRTGGNPYESGGSGQSGILSHGRLSITGVIADIVVFHTRICQSC